MQVKIISLIEKYLPQISGVISLTVRQTFIDNDILKINTKKEIIGEIERIISKIQLTITSKSKDKVFIAVNEREKVVGIIAIVRISDSQRDILEKAKIKNRDDILEISMCYVHPKFQRKGIRRKLLATCIGDIQRSSFSKYFMYSGYPISVSVWKKLLGKEHAILPNYFPDKQDCYVWYGDINELEIKQRNIILTSKKNPK